LYSGIFLFLRTSAPGRGYRGKTRHKQIIFGLVNAHVAFTALPSARHEIFVPVIKNKPCQNSGIRPKNIISCPWAAAKLARSKQGLAVCEVVILTRPSQRLACGPVVGFHGFGFVPSILEINSGVFPSFGVKQSGHGNFYNGVLTKYVLLSWFML